MPAVYQLQSNLQRRGWTSLKLDQVVPRPLPQYDLQVGDRHHRSMHSSPSASGLSHSWSVRMLASSVSPDEHLVIPRVQMHTQLELRPTRAKSLSCWRRCAFLAAHRGPNLSNHAENWEARRLPSHPPQSWDTTQNVARGEDERFENLWWRKGRQSKRERKSPCLLYIWSLRR